MHEIYSLEQLSNGETAAHKLHPAVKLTVTAVFIVCVASFNRYDLTRLTPYVFYPAAAMALLETPYSTLLKRFLPAVPFCFFAGLSNLIFDRAAAFSINGFAVTYGCVSFCVILLKAYLCVTAVFLLVSVTPFAQITNALRRFYVPDIFIIVLELTIRYQNVLSGEARTKYAAYVLRSKSKNGVRLKDMGVFLGGLFFASLSRAERVYIAMKCRGFPAREREGAKIPIKRADIVFGLTAISLCAALRVFNVYSFIRFV